MNNHMASNGAVDGAASGLTRERSFVNQNRRRSLALSVQHDIQQQQIRQKPAIEIYRPPSKLNRFSSCFEIALIYALLLVDIRSDVSSAQNQLNVNAPEFTVKTVQNTQPIGFFSSPNTYLQHSKSNGNIQHQIQLAVARRHAEHLINSPTRTILVSHPIQYQRVIDNSPTNTTQNVNALCFFCIIQYTLCYRQMNFFKLISLLLQK